MPIALLILTPHEPAVFSERAATEAEPRTLGAPTGAALLGWAARKYGDFDPHQYDLFHGGRPRFSNALPLTKSGAPAWPMPQLITQAKHRKGGSDEKRDWLVSQGLRVGRLPGTHDQCEPVRKVGFVARDGEVITPSLGSRLRTATKDGRAADGKLFGYQHLAPDGACRYAASVEAAAPVWKALRDRFEGQTLYLGRGANTAYGGAYACEWIEKDAEEKCARLWPRGEVAAGVRNVRVWALSDLALEDEQGGACFAPAPELLGLPKGGRLNGGDSAIGVRRYAAWNYHLESRDLERQVIAAGSVLSFHYPEGVPHSAPGSTVGLWQESGLGRIWVAPPLLAGDPGKPPHLTDTVPLASRLTAPGAPPRPANHELVAWLEAKR